MVQLIMVTQVFYGFIAFSLGLLAFCAGTWLTLWATSSNTECSEPTAAKMSGYFIVILAIIALVSTSYYTASTVFMGKKASYSKMSTWKGKKIAHVSKTKRGPRS